MPRRAPPFGKHRTCKAPVTRFQYEPVQQPHVGCASRGSEAPRQQSLVSQQVCGPRRVSPASRGSAFGNTLHAIPADPFPILVPCPTRESVVDALGGPKGGAQPRPQGIKGPFYFLSPCAFCRGRPRGRSAASRPNGNSGDTIPIFSLPFPWSAWAARHETARLLLLPPSGGPSR